MYFIVIRSLLDPRCIFPQGLLSPLLTWPFFLHPLLLHGLSLGVCSVCMGILLYLCVCMHTYAHNFTCIGAPQCNVLTVLTRLCREGEVNRLLF